MKKLTLSIILTMFTVTLSFANISFNPNADISKVNFTDVPANHWARNTIYKLAAQEVKVFNGYPDGTFKPNANMTKAEFVKALITALDVPVNTYSSFPDVSQNNWASKYIGTAEKLGIINKNDYTNFSPNSYITRYEIIRMIVNSSKNAKVLLNNDQKVKPKFDDEPDSVMVRKLINIAVGSKIISGYQDNTIRLYKTATRAEISTIILNFIKNYNALDAYIIPEADLKIEDPNRKEGYVGGTWTTYNDLITPSSPAYFRKLENQVGSGSKVTDFELSIDRVKAFKISKSQGLSVPNEYSSYFTKLKAWLKTPELIQNQILEVIKNDAEVGKYMYTFDECNVIALDYTLTTNSKVMLSNLHYTPTFYKNSDGEVIAISEYSTTQIEQLDLKKGVTGNVELYADKSLNKFSDNYFGRYVKYGNTYKFTKFIIVNKLPTKCIIMLDGGTSEDSRSLNIIYER